MRRVEAWQRQVALLLVGSLFLVYGPLYGQVGVRLIQPVESSAEASMAALQQARTSLIEARVAVDDALYEVERTLSLLAEDHRSLAEPAGLVGKVSPSQAPDGARVGGALSSLQQRIKTQISKTKGSLQTLFAGLPPALTTLRARLANLPARPVPAASDVDSAEARPATVSTADSGQEEEVGITLNLLEDLVLSGNPPIPSYVEILDPVVLPELDTPDAEDDEDELPTSPTDAELPPFDATVIRPEGLRLKRK